MVKRIVGLLYWLLCHVIKEVLFIAAPIIVKLCHRWVCTSSVDPLLNCAAHRVYFLHLNFWHGSTKSFIEITKYISACSVGRVITVCCIACVLYSTSRKRVWWNLNDVYLTDGQTLVDGHCGTGNQCMVVGNNERSIFDSHLSYATEVCLVIKIHNFSPFKSNLHS